MKAKDLMIGDWVAVHRPGDRHEQVRVKSVVGNGTIEAKTSDGLVAIGELAVEPIPLTAEILNKNFPKPNGDYWVEGDFPIIGYSIPCITDGNRPYAEVSIYDPARVMEFEMFFHYVHELQHALRLCGIEKEIEL